MASYSARVPLLPRTGNSTLPARLPRDDQLRIPGKLKADRPSPINTFRDASQYIPRAPPSSRRESSEQAPRSPEIVDLQEPDSRQRHDRVQRRNHSDRNVLGSPYVSASARQSEISFGILDYYMDRTPIPTPQPVTRPADEDIAAFDFGLDAGPQRSSTIDVPTQPSTTTVEASQISLQTTSNTSSGGPIHQHRENYSLFPAIAPQHNVIAEAPSPTTAAFAQPTDPSRPRKASLPTRLRTDSCTSIRLLPSATITSSPQNSTGPRRPMPIRISRTSTLHSASDISPPQSSRWSGDTAATTPDSLTSPVSGRGSQDPLLRGLGRLDLGDGASGGGAPLTSFFEDDDEDDERVPLSRRLRGWKRRGGASMVSPTGSFGQGEMPGVAAKRGGWVRKWVLCGACLD